MALDKGRLHHHWRQLTHLKVWILIVLAVIFTACSAFFLRQNNLGMVKRRDAVIAADKQGGDVDKSLQALRSYMARHMNTRMGGPVQLKYSYDREVQRRVNEAAKSGKANNSSAYERAQEECKTASTVAYANCVIEKTSAQAPGSNPVTQVKNPPVELFSFQFYSPAWSPDVAGFFVLALVLTLLLLMFRLIGSYIARAIFKHHQ